jgi:hypothetical protein
MANANPFHVIGHARVARSISFANNATSAELDLLESDYKASIEFFMTDPRLFGNDCPPAANGARDRTTISRYFLLLLESLIQIYPARALKLQAVIDEKIALQQRKTAVEHTGDFLEGVRRGTTRIPSAKIALATFSKLTKQQKKTAGFEQYVEPFLQRSTVVMIPKKDKANGPADYRPISLVPTLYKLIERIIFARIKPRLAGNAQSRSMPRALGSQLTPLEQAGFTTERSTTQQVLFLRLARERAGRDDKDLYVVSYDQAKAFDSAQWTEIALAMARSGRWHWRECRLALHWMQGHTRRLLINGSLSDEIVVTRGVPQGGVLSPTLYNEHVATLIARMDALGDAQGAERVQRVKINDTFDISLTAFADDIDSYTYTTAEAATVYQIAAKPWSTETASAFNEPKFVATLLAAPTRRAGRSPEDIVLGNITLKTGGELKQLGSHHSSANPRLVHPIAHVMNSQGKAVPAVLHSLINAHRCLSPWANASPKLSVIVMRTACEQRLLFSSGVTAVNDSHASMVLARICKIALGAHISTNSARTLAFCGMPTAAATALKMTLSLVHGARLIREVVRCELERAWDASDAAGETWRSMLVERLCELHPNTPPTAAKWPAAPNATRAAKAAAAAASSALANWCLPLLLTSMAPAAPAPGAAAAPAHAAGGGRGGGQSPWQLRVLDPIADALWPKPHPAFAHAAHDATYTWHLYSERFVPRFILPLPICGGCGGVLTPRHLVGCVAFVGVQALLSAPIGNLRNYDAKAQPLISAASYQALVEKAARDPWGHNIDVSGVQVPAGVPREPDDVLAARKHVTACVARDAAAIHKNVYSRVAPAIRAAYRVYNANRAAAAAAAAPGGGAAPQPPQPPAPPQPPQPPAPPAQPLQPLQPLPQPQPPAPPAPPQPPAPGPPGGGGGGAPGEAPAHDSESLPHNFHSGYLGEFYDDDDDDDDSDLDDDASASCPPPSNCRSTRTHGLTQAGPASNASGATTAPASYSLARGVVNPGGSDSGRSDGCAGRHAKSAGDDVDLPDDATLDAALVRAELLLAELLAFEAERAHDPEDETPTSTADRSTHACEKTTQHRPAAEIDETWSGAPATAAPATAEATDDPSSSSSRRPRIPGLARQLEWGMLATEPSMPTHPAVGNIRRSNRIAARAERVGLQAEDRTDAAATAAGMEEGSGTWRDDLQLGASIESLPPAVSSDAGTGEQTERRTTRALAVARLERRLLSAKQWSWP